MLLLAADARRALAAVLGDDRGAHVALESAAALHLGRPLALPIVVVARERSTGGLVKCVPLASPRPQLSSAAPEGLRVAGLEATLVELCSRPTRPLAIVLAAELLRAESVLERRRCDPALLVRLARRMGSGAGQRRLAFLLHRAGLTEHARALLPAARTGAIKLDPLGPPGGPTVGRFRVRLGVADGFPAGDLARSWVRLAREVLGAAASEVALRVQLGVPLPIDPTLAEAEARGLLAREGDALLPRAPFDEVCARIGAAVTSRRRSAIVAALAQRADPPARADAALLEPDARKAVRLLGDGARAIDVRRAQALLERLGPQLPRDVRLALLERTGRYAEAAAVVRHNLSLARGRARAELLLSAAQLAWRRARKREARACLDELDALAARDATDALTIEALLLRAALAAEAGGHERARRLLSRALRAADRAGRDLDRARALHRLGTVEARQGRPVEASAAYRAALEIVAPRAAEQRALVGILESNLAATAAWLGRWDEAEGLARAALVDKRVAGTAAEVASTRVLLSRIARARGDRLPPGGRVTPVLEDVERAGDARLRVEVLLDLAEELGREGQPGQAAPALERARADLLALDRAEPILDALFAHVEGLVRGLAGERAAAIATIDGAARALDRLHGAFWAARARRDAAALADAAGHPDDALERLRAVARACEEHRFVLGEERTHVALTALAALSDDPPLVAWAERALGSLGPAEVRARLVELGLGARAAALRARTSAATADAFVLDERRALLVRPDGARVDLSRRRVLLPLLSALAGGEPVALDELTRTLWSRRDASARAAAKMAISRLRAVLGPRGDELVAVRVGGELCYRLTEPLSVRPG